MFVLGFILGAGLMAAVAIGLAWWWTLPAAAPTSLEARQAIWEIERRTVQALLREEGAVAAHIDGKVVEEQP